MWGVLSRGLQSAYSRAAVRAGAMAQARRTGRLRAARHQLQWLEAELTGGHSAGLRARIAASGAPAELAAACRTALVHAGGEFFEAVAARRFLETVARVPWQARAAALPPAEAEAAVEALIWGGESARAKAREIARRRDRRPVVCFYGPPGTGKSHLAQAFAGALGLPFARVPLGGLRGEAALRGAGAERRDGAPGRLIEAVCAAGSFDAVVLLDDADKIDDPEGGLWAALLDLAEPTARRAFFDRYLGVPIDFSRTWFLIAAGEPAPLPQALRDRVEPFWLRGYDDAEKRALLQTAIWPQAALAAGCPGARLARGAADILVGASAGEAGVRELTRAAERLAGRTAPGAAGALGAAAARKAVRRRSERLPPERPGRVFGLAWTPLGGAVMPIEVVLLPGGGGVRVTGRVGEVMGESIQAAYTWFRNHADLLGIDPETAARGLHVHFPEAATPKDGASAGLTLVAGLVSAYRGRVLLPRCAFTGEITVMGDVLPVGGVREKLLAALRRGLHNVVLPAANAAEVKELAAADRRRLKVRYVRTLGDWLMPEKVVSPQAFAPVGKDLIC